MGGAESPLFVGKKKAPRGREGKNFFNKYTSPKANYFQVGVDLLYPYPGGRKDPPGGGKKRYYFDTTRKKEPYSSSAGGHPLAWTERKHTLKRDDFFYVWGPLLVNFQKEFPLRRSAQKRRRKGKKRGPGAVELGRLVWSKRGNISFGVRRHKEEGEREPTRKGHALLGVRCQRAIRIFKKKRRAGA